MKTTFLIVLTLLANFVFAQSDNIHYTDLVQTDSRIEVTLHHGRTIGFGSQYVGVAIKNKTNHKLRVVLEFYVNLTCGEQLKKKIGSGNGIIVKPGEQTKPSGFWDTDNTSMDAGESRSSECLKSENKSIELADGGWTVISSVGFTLNRIDELDENNSVIIQTNTSSNSSTSTSSSSSTANQNSEINSSNNSNTNCPPQSITMVNNPSDNCVQLRWINQSTISYNKNSEEINVNGAYPIDFILVYRRSEDSDWKEIKLHNYQLSYNLVGLDACTKYEVKLQRDCGNNKSAFSNVITFSTACVSPKNITITNITNSSAKIGGIYTPALNTCSLNSQKPMRILEYKTITSDWIVKVCVMGQECPLTNLNPNTMYQVRVKYQYENAKFSEYSSEKTFKTLP